MINVVTPGGIAISTGCSGRLSIISDVRIVVRNSISTETNAGNIAAISATLPTDSGVAIMNKEEFRNEKLYQTTMHLAKKMLEEDIISETEYRQIDTIFLKKYRPVFGTLFSDISLTFEP